MAAFDLYWLRWTGEKLKARSPLYLPRRVSYALRKRMVDRIFPLTWRDGRGVGPVCGGRNPRELLDYFRSRGRPRFHFQPQEVEAVCSRIPSAQKEATIREAEEILRHRFAFRGQKPLVLDPVDWDRSPSGIVGWVWDLNRHFYFAKLGFAYWYTRDLRFAREFFDLSSSWIKTHIRDLGRIAWDTPFEVAARVNGWIWAYFLFLPCPAWSPEAHRLFLLALKRMAQYLFHVIEYHDRGNHPILEAKALALCAGLFPEFAGASRWKRKAWRILMRQVKEQICCDGVFAERSTMYHRIVAGELAELMHFCERNEMRPPVPFAELVHKMAAFSFWIEGEKQGSVALFGDAYLDDSYLRFSPSLLVQGLQGPGKILSARNGEEQSLWALGPRRRLPGRGGSLPGETARAFPWGGYYISRSDWEDRSSVLVWDCGPVGDPANPYHAHLDALSFHLVVHGSPLLIDPGTNEWDDQKRAYLRSTAAHNTVFLDGQSQAILARRNEVWAPYRARPHFFGSVPEGEVMIGSHDGYQRLSSPLGHLRAIVAMRRKYWVVLDCLQGSGRHRAEQRFHVSPGASVSWEVPGHIVRITHGEANLLVIPFSFSGSRVESPSPQMQIEKGLAEMECGRPQEIPVLNHLYDGPFPFWLGVLLLPGRGPVAARPRTVEEGNRLQAVEVSGEGFEDTVYFRLGPEVKDPTARTRQLQIYVAVKTGREARGRFFLAAPERPTDLPKELAAYCCRPIPNLLKNRSGALREE